MSGEDTAALGPLELLCLARRVGLAYARDWQAATGRKAIQQAAQEVYQAVRRRGTSQQKIILPDGTEVATISIERGPVSYHVDEIDLFQIALGNQPADIEDFIKPVALTDPEVIALLAEHFPHYAGRQISRAARERYQKELEEHDGCVLNEQTGEREQVAKVTRLEATGKFSVRWADKDKSPRLLLDAFDGGAFDAAGAAEGDEDPEESGPAGGEAGEPA